MRISPGFQLVAVAAAGSIGAAAIDVLINSHASGVHKIAGIVIPSGLAANLALALSWAFFLALGPGACAYFRPLTRRSAFAVAFGMAAVFSILAPPA